MALQLHYFVLKKKVLLIFYKRFYCFVFHTINENLITEYYDFSHKQQDKLITPFIETRNKINLCVPSVYVH